MPQILDPKRKKENHQKRKQKIRNDAFNPSKIRNDEFNPFYSSQYMYKPITTYT